MANSRKTLPPLYRDALNAFARMARNMGNIRERELINEASKALQRGDVDRALDFLKLCLKSPNLTYGEQEILKGYIKSLNPNIFARLSWIAMKMWPFLVMILHEFSVDIVIAIWKIIYESLSIYRIFYGNSKLYYQTTNV